MVAPVPRGAPRLRPAPSRRASHGAPRAFRSLSWLPSSLQALANMALVPCQVLRVAILLSYCSILCNYKAIEMPSHQTYGGSWKFLTFIDLVRPSSPSPVCPAPEPDCLWVCEHLRESAPPASTPVLASSPVIASKGLAAPTVPALHQPTFPGDWGTSGGGGQPGGGVFGGKHRSTSKR